jgi:hypothetical protein
VPEYIVHLIGHQLRDRRTRLKFDDFTSDWIDINNGSGQGDPKSMLEYIYYNADLIDLVKKYGGIEDEEDGEDEDVPKKGSARERGVRAQKRDEEEWGRHSRKQTPRSQTCWRGEEGGMNGRGNTTRDLK